MSKKNTKSEIQEVTDVLNDLNAESISEYTPRRQRIIVKKLMTSMVKVAARLKKDQDQINIMMLLLLQHDDEIAKLKRGFGQMRK